MYDESVPLCLFYACAEGGDTSLFSFPVFKSWGGLGSDERSRDLNRVVEIGGDYVFLLGGGGTSLLDLLKLSAHCQMEMFTTVSHQRMVNM
jgi:hypothetical protein